MINQLVTVVSLSSVLPTHSSGAYVVASIAVVNHKRILRKSSLAKMRNS